MFVRLLAILAFTVVLTGAEQAAVTTKTLDWGSIVSPEAAAVGDQVEIVVTLSEAERAKGGILRIDPHWYKGRDRGGVAGSVGKQTINANQETYTFNWTIPAKDGITAISLVTYLGDGSWSGKRVTGTGRIVVK
ncbi:MAG: hypothetical protein PF961_21350 [Planctomycetota bacterium]|jgi:hypothetical protein|nr:hypothetical protein [Planctomycetota bacterium]